MPPKPLCISSRPDRCPTDVQSFSSKADHDVILKSNSPPLHPWKINTIKFVRHVSSYTKLHVRSRLNLSKVNHHPIFKSCPAYRALPACRLSELLRGCKVGHAANGGGHGRGRALKESPATPKCPHSTKKGTSCGHRSDTFIKSTHVPHFSFFFEVISQTDWEEPKRGGGLSPRF